MALILVVLSLGVIALSPVVLLAMFLRLSARARTLTEREAALKTRIAELEEQVATLKVPPMPRDPAPDSDPAPAPELSQTPDPMPPLEPETQTPDPSPAPAAAPDPGQPMLPFGDSAAPPLDLEDTIRALNFPQDAQDHAGFAVLRRALQSHQTARLLQASEDCLNYMAHQGLYMDDLLMAPAEADDWRSFAKGGAARAALLPITGIMDREAVGTVQSLMRADAIFRDAALHFQRKFDTLLQGIAPEASDADLLNLIDTRTGRAFVLIAQASGSLDRTP